jgi:hypothetical protein
MTWEQVTALAIIVGGVLLGIMLFVEPILFLRTLGGGATLVFFWWLIEG